MESWIQGFCDSFYDKITGKIFHILSYTLKRSNGIFFDSVVNAKVKGFL
jgi:hypothetical protein